jgi:hypothetical protein
MTSSKSISRYVRAWCLFTTALAFDIFLIDALSYEDMIKITVNEVVGKW